MGRGHGCGIEDIIRLKCDIQQHTTSAAGEEGKKPVLMELFQHFQLRFWLRAQQSMPRQLQLGQLYTIIQCTRILVVYVKL